MSTVRYAWADDLERMRRIYEASEERLKDYPKGSLHLKKIKGNEYYYLFWRDGDKVCSKYVGQDPEALRDIKLKIGARKERESDLRKLADDIRLLEKAVKLKG